VLNNIVTWYFIVVNVRVATLHGDAAFERSVQLTSLFPIRGVLADAVPVDTCYLTNKDVNNSNNDQTYTQRIEILLYNMQIAGEKFKEINFIEQKLITIYFVSLLGLQQNFNNAPTPHVLCMHVIFLSQIPFALYS
jgi:hypothetical protein